jgi:O-antigen/teichoic acid export membrane protein
LSIYSNILRYTKTKNNRFILSTYFPVAAAFFQNIFILRLLGSDEFGSLNLIIFMVYSVKEILYFRIWESINKFLSNFKAENNIEKMKAYIKFSILIEFLTALASVIIIVSLGGFVVDFFYEGKINVYYLYLYSLILFIESPYEIFNAVLRIENKYEVLIKSNYVFPIFKMVLILSLLLFSSTILSAIIGFIVSSFIINAYMIISSYKEIGYMKGVSRTKLSILKAEKKSIIHFLTYSNVTGIIKVVQKRLDVLVVGYFLSLNAVAYYRMIKYLSDFIAFPLNPVYYNSFVTFNRLKSKGKFNVFKKLYLHYTRNSIIYGVLVFVFILLFNEVILDAYIKTYADSVRDTFIFYSAGVCLATISNFNYPLFTVSNNNKVAALIMIGAMIIQYAIILSFMPYGYGLITAGYGYFFSYVFWYICSNYFIIRNRKVIFA